jgi:uncharacterized protein YjbI with pentapeptide repeats
LSLALSHTPVLTTSTPTPLTPLPAPLPALPSTLCPLPRLTLPCFRAFNKGATFVGCDFTNAVVDRVIFDESDLRKAVFSNAVLSGTTFTNANLQDTDFTDAYLGPFDLKNLCGNPTLTGTNPKTGQDTKESAGCLQ